MQVCHIDFDEYLVATGDEVWISILANVPILGKFFSIKLGLLGRGACAPYTFGFSRDFSPTKAIFLNLSLIHMHDGVTKTVPLLPATYSSFPSKHLFLL